MLLVEMKRNGQILPGHLVMFYIIWIGVWEKTCSEVNSKILL